MDPQTTNIKHFLRTMAAVFFAAGIAQSHGLCCFLCGIFLVLTVIGIARNE